MIRDRCDRFIALYCGLVCFLSSAGAGAHASPLVWFALALWPAFEISRDASV